MAGHDLISFKQIGESQLLGEPNAVSSCEPIEFEYGEAGKRESGSGLNIYIYIICSSQLLGRLRIVGSWKSIQFSPEKIW